MTFGLAAAAPSDESRRSEDVPPQSPGTTLERLRGRDGRKMWKFLSRQNPRPAQSIRVESSASPRLQDEPLPPEAKVLPAEPHGLIAKPAIHDPTKDGRRRTTAQIEPIPEAVDPVRDPRDLKRLSSILPYSDYEPDLTLEDPCQNLCPRPGHCPDCQRKRPEDLAPGEVGCQECPEEVVLSRESYTERCFPTFGYAWEPSNVHYCPLYFQDVPLERYGHTRSCYIQPVFSVGKFTAQMLFLPYQLSLNPPWRHQSPLGYYRPGQSAPYKYYQVPLDPKAAAVQATAVTGAYYLFAP